MSRCLLCVHVWLENACERGVAVRLGSWSGVTMARTPFLVPVPCIVCYIVVDCTFLRCIDWTWYPKTFVVATLQIPDFSLPLPAYRHTISPAPRWRMEHIWFEKCTHGQIPDLSHDKSRICHLTNPGFVTSLVHIFRTRHVPPARPAGGAGRGWYVDRRAMRASVSLKTGSVRKPGVLGDR
jgi:hypothetical protein